MSEKRIIDELRARNELKTQSDDEIKEAFKNTIVWAGLGFHFAMADFSKAAKKAFNIK